MRINCDISHAPKEHIYICANSCSSKPTGAHGDHENRKTSWPKDQIYASATGKNMHVDVTRTDKNLQVHFVPESSSDSDSSPSIISSQHTEILQYNQYRHDGRKLTQENRFCENQNLKIEKRPHKPRPRRIKSDYSLIVPKNASPVPLLRYRSASLDEGQHGNKRMPGYYLEKCRPEAQNYYGPPLPQKPPIHPRRRNISNYYPPRTPNDVPFQTYPVSNRNRLMCPYMQETKWPMRTNDDRHRSASRVPTRQPQFQAKPRHKSDPQRAQQIKQTFSQLHEVCSSIRRRDDRPETTDEWDDPRASRTPDKKIQRIKQRRRRHVTYEEDIPKNNTFPPPPKPYRHGPPRPAPGPSFYLPNREQDLLQSVKASIPRHLSHEKNYYIRQRSRTSKRLEYEEPNAGWESNFSPSSNSEMFPHKHVHETEIEERLRNPNLFPDEHDLFGENAHIPNDAAAMSPYLQRLQEIDKELAELDKSLKGRRQYFSSQKPPTGKPPPPEPGKEIHRRVISPTSGEQRPLPLVDEMGNRLLFYTGKHKRSTYVAEDTGGDKSVDI